MRPVTKPYMKSNNDSDYDVKRVFLINELGNYCSYCEAPISMDSAIEHKVPKSENKGLEQYDTVLFNLLLACNSCNSSKGTTPDKKLVDNWEKMKDEELFIATMNLWIWPDETLDRNGESYLSVDNSYALLKPVFATYTQKELYNKELVRIKEEKLDEDWTESEHTKVWIVPNEEYIQEQSDSEELLKRVKSTIQGFNLNHYDDSDQRFNDRRVINRTNAYFTAKNTCEQFFKVLTEVNDNKGSIYKESKTDSEPIYQPTVLLAIQSTRLTALATGFWTIWFTVFRNALDNGKIPSSERSLAPNLNEESKKMLGTLSVEQRKLLLIHLLVNFVPMERNDFEEVRIFPGTNLDLLFIEENQFK